MRHIKKMVGLHLDMRFNPDVKELKDIMIILNQVDPAEAQFDFYETKVVNDQVRVIDAIVPLHVSDRSAVFDNKNENAKINIAISVMTEAANSLKGQMSIAQNDEGEQVIVNHYDAFMEFIRPAYDALVPKEEEKDEVEGEGS